MQLKIETGSPEQITTDALAFLCFEAEDATAAPALAQQSGWLDEVRASGEFVGKLYELSVLHRPSGVAAKRIVVIGAGKREK